MDEFAKLLDKQAKHPKRGSNAFLAGINAHNIGVLLVLMGQRQADALKSFHQAVDWKKRSFGPQHTQVALSLEELGIQHFSRQEWPQALEVMNQCRKAFTQPQHLIMVLNNLACVHLAMHNHVAAMVTLRNARDLHHDTKSSSLDLLHAAMTIANLGYVLIQMKQYEEARAMFEEALLVSGANDPTAWTRFVPVLTRFCRSSSPS